MPLNAGAASQPAAAKNTVSHIPKTEEAKSITHSEPENPAGQAKVVNTPIANLATSPATGTPAKISLANPQSPQQKIKPAQGMAANIPQPDNTQQPPAGPALTTRIQLPNKLRIPIKKDEAASKPNDISNVPTPIQPGKKIDTLISDINANK